MRRWLLTIVLSHLLLLTAHGQQQRQELIVDEPFIELRTGPGRGYPIFYIAERGERIALLRRRTDWFLIEGPRAEEGWVHREQLLRTLDLNGEPFDLQSFGFRDHIERRWEVGIQYGDFGGANVVAAYGGYSISEHLAVELWLSQVLGRFSNSDMVNANIVHLLYPERRWSPFFTLGTGVVRTKPKATLVVAADRRDSAAHAGLGVRGYLAGRFVFRAEYKSYVAFTSRDDNEEVREWKAGFSFFF